MCCCCCFKNKNSHQNKEAKAKKTPRSKISLTHKRQSSTKSTNPASSKTLSSLPTTSPAANPNVPNLMEQRALHAQYLREVEEMRRAYESNYRRYHEAYLDRSLSQVSNTNFTDIIDLPKGSWRTHADVLKAKHYTLEKKVGHGGYGVVYRAKFSHKGVTSVVACKTITCVKGGGRKKLLKNMKAELFILEKYPHPNIITLYDHFVIDDKAYIMMEFADAGSLADLLEKNGQMSEHVAYEYFVQILKGIFYLHTFHIAHRDLKPDNVLMVKSKKNPSEKIVKITDFGLSKQVYRPKDGYIKPGNYGGTKYYMSPEIFASDLYGEFDEELGEYVGFDPFRADIWALGVILYECLCINLPFERIKGGSAGMYEAQIRRKWKFPDDIKLSADVKRLIEEMLEPDPQMRIDPYGIWMHRWIQNSYVANQGWKSRLKGGGGDAKQTKRSFVGSIIKIFKK